MSLTEIGVALIGLLSSSVIAFLAYQRGRRADDDAHDNAATALVYAGYGGLLQRLEQDNGDCRRRLKAAEERIAIVEKLLQAERSQ